MSHFTEITVTGLAGRDGVYKQELNREVNIFFGLNGSGKTSLLRILHSAMQDDPEILYMVPFEKAEVKFYSITFDKIFTRRITKSNAKQAIRAPGADVGEIQALQRDLFHTQQRKDSEIQWQTSPPLPAKSIPNFSHKYLPTSRLYIGPDSPAVNTGFATRPASEEALEFYFARSLERLWTSYSADILSKVSKAQQDGLASILKAVLSTKKKGKVRRSKKIDSQIAYNRLSSFLQRQGSPRLLGSFEDFQKRYEKETSIRGIVEDINEIEKGIEKAIIPRDKLQSLIQEMFGETKIVFGDQEIDVTARDKTKITLPFLSSGQKQVLKIFVETLTAEANSLLIDEPEISLHVDWQKKLVSSMRQLNPTTQLILATHSPEIMAEVEDENIFRL